MTSKRLYKSKAGDLVIEQAQQIPSPDDTAYINGNLAPTGKYEVGEEKFILISNGKVYATRGTIEPGIDIDLIDNITDQIEVEKNPKPQKQRRIQILGYLLFYFLIWAFLFYENPDTSDDSKMPVGYILSAAISFLAFFSVFLYRSIKTKGIERNDNIIAFVLTIIPVLYAIPHLIPSEKEIIITQNLPEYIKKRMRDSIDNACTQAYPSTNDPRTQIPYQKAKYEIDTLNVKYLLEYTQILAISGEINKAYNLLINALKWSDKKAKIYNSIGDVWQTIATFQMNNKINYQAALDSSFFYIKKACEMDSTDVDLFISLYNFYDYEKKYNEAIKVIEHTMKIKPNNRTLYLFRGTAKYHLEDYKGAYEDLTPITDIRRIDYTWYFYRALAGAELGKYNEAVQDLDTCEMLNYKEAQLYYVRGKFKTHIKERKREGFLEAKKAILMGYPAPKDEQEKIEKKLSEVTI